MALTVKWTLQAEKGLDQVIHYLELEWTVKEILNLEKKINHSIKLIITNPDLFPKTEKFKHLHKVVIDKNNYLIYRLNSKKNQIEIINFRGTKQKPRY